jgi:hypothetical protein
MAVNRRHDASWSDPIANDSRPNELNLIASVGSRHGRCRGVAIGSGGPSEAEAIHGGARHPCAIDPQVPNGQKGCRQIGYFIDIMHKDSVPVVPRAVNAVVAPVPCFQRAASNQDRRRPGRVGRAPDDPPALGVVGVVVGAAFQEKGAADAIVAVRRAVLEADVKVVGKVVGAGEGGQRQRQVARQRAERGNVEVAAACRQRQREQCQGTSEHERLEHDTGSLIYKGERYWHRSI